MIKKRLIGLFILLFCLSGLAMACEEPEADKAIEQDVVLCDGEYKMDNGLQIASDNIKVECQDTVLRGYNNEEAFSVINRENVTITGCELDNFQIGVRVTNSDSISLSDNLIVNNQVGILMEESNENLFADNVFDNNTNYGVYLDNKSKVNTFRGNQFFSNAFNIQKAEDAPLNNYQQNEYINSQGPANYSTDYEIQEEEEEQKEKTVETHEEEEYFQEDNISERDVLTQIYEAQELDPSDYLERDLEQIQKANEKIETTRRVTVNYKENTTTFTNTYKAKENVSNVQIYEYIPKSIANNVDELEISNQNYTVLKDDPLIMWKKENMKAGEEVDTSYKVNKVVKEEKPEGTVCVDCTKKKRSYSFLIPLVLIPVIVFGFIIFDRMQKNPEQ